MVKTLMRINRKTSASKLKFSGLYNLMPLFCFSVLAVRHLDFSETR